jgi:hypothetical protein
MGQNKIPGSNTERNRAADFISDLTRRRCISILMATPDTQPLTRRLF